MRKITKNKKTIHKRRIVIPPCVPWFKVVKLKRIPSGHQQLLYELIVFEIRAQSSIFVNMKIQLVKIIFFRSFVWRI